jgi:hypothetical protein
MAETHPRKSNLDALKAIYENKAKGNYRFWKPLKNGRYIIRFLPAYKAEGLFFRASAQYKIGDNYYWAPHADDRPDPIYDYYRALYAKGDDASIALAKEIKPRKQYLYNIIVRDELGIPAPNPKEVKVYCSGKILYDCLMDYFFDDEYGDLTDVDNGYDFQLVKEDGDMGFPNYKKSKPKKTASPLFEDAEDIDEVLQNLKDLDKEIDYKSAKELAEILEEFLDTRKATQGLVNGASNRPKTEDEAPGAAKAPVAAKASTKTDDEDYDDFEKQLLEDIDEE